jgi:hypothetical protein
MYEDVGHSNEARKTMKKYIIGSLEVQIRFLGLNLLRDHLTRFLLLCGRVLNVLLFLLLFDFNSCYKIRNFINFSCWIYL